MFDLLTEREVSTHTPAWGVTDEAEEKTIDLQGFYSHARMGRDSNTAEELGLTTAFLLTRPHGA